MCLQVVLHPFLTQEKLLRFCREASIAVTGFSPPQSAARRRFNDPGDFCERAFGTFFPIYE